MHVSYPWTPGLALTAWSSTYWSYKAGVKLMASKITQLVMDARELIYVKHHGDASQKGQFDYVFTDYLVAAYQDLRQYKSIQHILNRNHINSLIHLLLVAQKSSSQYTAKCIQHIVDYLYAVEEDICQDRLSQVLCCKNEMKLRNRMLCCYICGYQTPINKKSARMDKKDAVSKNTSYQALKHFESVFKSIFVHQGEDIPSDVMQELRQFMARDQKTRITIEDVRQYLKQLTKGRGSKLNKLDAAIMYQLNGDQALRLSPKEYNFIRDIYQYVVQVFYQNNTERNNTPSASYLIRCIIDLLYRDLDTKRHSQLIKLIHVQKEQTVLKIQRTWSNILKQIDADQIKEQFRYIMRG